MRSSTRSWFRKLPWLEFSVPATSELLTVPVPDVPTTPFTVMNGNTCGVARRKRMRFHDSSNSFDDPPLKFVNSWTAAVLLFSFAWYSPDVRKNELLRVNTSCVERL